MEGVCQPTRILRGLLHDPPMGHLTSGMAWTTRGWGRSRIFCQFRSWHLILVWSETCNTAARRFFFFFAGLNFFGVGFVLFGDLHKFSWSRRCFFLWRKGHDLKIEVVNICICIYLCMCIFCVEASHDFDKSWWSTGITFFLSEEYIDGGGPQT